ncbi:MAG: T9SS type A sorting domain-containing protein [Sphingobacteriaceae bacterium]|nr:T9SS type A sorting domain-containing protein [Sphingobacteriaceae bacterium]
MEGLATYYAFIPHARVILGIDPQPQMALRQQFSDELRFVAESSINVFPNPAQNDVKISMDGMSQLNYRYSITDLQGKLVAKGDVGVLDGYGHIQLNGLNNGVYVLQLINGSEHHQSKLIVLKP